MCSPETPLLCTLFYLSVPAIPSYWLGSIYPITCCKFISLGGPMCFAKCAVLSLQISLSLYCAGLSLSIITVGLFLLGLYILTCITLQDTGNHPPRIAFKPYTLPLKYYEWVQREIEMLEHTGIIESSISPWASPVVIVPKKSAPGKPPRRRMCIDYRRINKLQPEVTKADRGKGCISLIPLPKIDELYAKLKGYKVF